MQRDAVAAGDHRVDVDRDSLPIALDSHREDWIRDVPVNRFDWLLSILGFDWPLAILNYVIRPSLARALRLILDEPILPAVAAHLTCSASSWEIIEWFNNVFKWI